MDNGSRRTRILGTVAAGMAAAILLSACADGSLADQYRAGSNKNYIAGDGSVTEIASANRLAPIDCAGTLESGATTTPADYRGQVLVLNFWYAGCAPCRAEAPDLEALWTQYQDQNVSFLGVNIRDQLSTARGFATYGITYPSVIDAGTGPMQLAFSGTVAPNAVPTPIVLDPHGRTSARILGRIPDSSVLDALIKTALESEG